MALFWATFSKRLFTYIIIRSRKKIKKLDLKFKFWTSFSTRLVFLDSFEKVDKMNAKKKGFLKPTVEPAVDYLVLENGMPKVDAVS